MHLYELPADIVHQILIQECINIESILNLSSTNKCLRHIILGDDRLWKKIYFDNWGDIYQDYEIDTNTGIPSAKQYYELSLGLHRASQALHHDLSLYEVRGARNIGYYLNEYSYDDHFIGIILRIYRQKYKLLLSDLRRFQDVDLTQVSLLANLVNCHNFRIGLSNLSNNHDSLLEGSWFRSSIMNNGSQDLIHNRRTKLDMVRRRLYTNIYNKELQLQNSDKILLVNNILKFNDELTYIKFVIKVISTAYSCFSINSLVDVAVMDESYYDEYYIEDFDILRVYSDLAKGHPLVILSILQKILLEFFAQFDSIMVDNQPIIFKAEITKLFLKINFNTYVFASINRGSTRPFTLQAFTNNEIATYIRNLNLRPNNMREYLSPIEKSRYNDVVINIGALGSLLSLNTCVFFERRTTLFLNSNEIKFKEFMCKFMLYESIGGYSDFLFCSSFEKHLMNLNNFIHFGTIYQLIKQKRNGAIIMLSNYFRLKSDIEPGQFFIRNVDLLDINSAISFYKVVQSRVSSSKAGMSRISFRGHLIKHSRFSTTGVILGCTDNTNSQEPSNTYYYVYTRARSVEVYDSNSCVWIYDPVRDRELVANFVEKGGIEIIGLLYFTKLRYMDGTPFFIEDVGVSMG